MTSPFSAMRSRSIQSRRPPSIDGEPSLRTTPATPIAKPRTPSPSSFDPTSFLQNPTDSSPDPLRIRRNVFDPAKRLKAMGRPRTQTGKSATGKGVKTAGKVGEHDVLVGDHDSSIRSGGKELLARDGTEKGSKLNATAKTTGKVIDYAPSLRGKDHPPAREVEIEGEDSVDDVADIHPGIRAPQSRDSPFAEDDRPRESPSYVGHAYSIMTDINAKPKFEPDSELTPKPMPKSRTKTYGRSKRHLARIRLGLANDPSDGEDLDHADRDGDRGIDPHPDLEDEVDSDEVGTSSVPAWKEDGLGSEKGPIKDDAVEQSDVQEFDELDGHGVMEVEFDIVVGVTNRNDADGNGDRTEKGENKAESSPGVIGDQDVDMDDLASTAATATAIAISPISSNKSSHKPPTSKKPKPAPTYEPGSATRTKAEADVEQEIKTKTKIKAQPRARAVKPKNSNIATFRPTSSVTAFSSISPASALAHLPSLVHCNMQKFHPPADSARKQRQPTSDEEHSLHLRGIKFLPLHLGIILKSLEFAQRRGLDWFEMASEFEREGLMGSVVGGGKLVATAIKVGVDVDATPVSGLMEQEQDSKSRITTGKKRRRSEVDNEDGKDCIAATAGGSNRIGQGRSSGEDAGQKAKGKRGAGGGRSQGDRWMDGTELYELYHNHLLPALKEGRPIWLADDDGGHALGGPQAKVSGG